ncbi:hypothetical protein RHSIM_Rhsim02G0186900 [Rhododendron simsii]|uniref:Arf-GAP domain-containing protein n=1 Tax=Rhododendron simsii TaxID=118357 RepID=A0A834H9X1_RHOSS|nr:hypothetical protein RHSIM_Rhsim02G0186900 [Rhododendron simsii]
MSNRMKEEERIERIIRNLLKLPENRRCINCNSLGPQYVCTTFWTFVCTTCSGVHREFTHRVKSVSMAKFNAEEVSALQAGGNERARQIYFKEWDPQRHSYPDGRCLSALTVVLLGKFAGDRGMGKLAMVRAGAKEDFSDRCSFETPSAGGRNDDRKSKYYIEERRSPRNKPENVRSGHRNRPVHFEVVDDRFRDDGLGSGRSYETHRSSNAESRAGSRLGKISPPVARPVSELLGENVPRLQVGGSPNANERRDTDSSVHVESKSLEPKTVNSVSLIDFSADPEPPDPGAAPQTQQTALSIDGGNGASDIPVVNSLESLLFGLSAPAAAPVDIMSEALAIMDGESAAPLALSNNVGGTVAESTSDKPAASPVGMELMLLSSSNDSNVGFTDGQKLPITQQNQLYSSLSGDGISTTLSVGASHSSHSQVKLVFPPEFSRFSRLIVLECFDPFTNEDVPVILVYLQSWTTSNAPNAQASSSVSAEKPSQPSSEATQDGMKELPADLFTSNYSSFPVSVPGWQVRPPHGMGFHMQYHPTAVPVPAYPNSPRSRNPFDLSDDATEAQVPMAMLPSMSPVQGALPNLPAPSALMHVSDAHSSHLMHPRASPYGSVAPPQLLYGMSLAPGAFNEQQFHNGFPFSRPQMIHTGREDAFASLNPIQQPGGRYPAAPTTTNSLSSAGGNPFG